MRILVFQVLAIIILPRILELNSAWLSVSVAELFAIIVSITCFIKNGKKYEYM